MNRHSLEKIGRQIQDTAWNIRKRLCVDKSAVDNRRFSQIEQDGFQGRYCVEKGIFEDFRFSEDLDFVCLEDVSDDFMSFIRDHIKELDVGFKVSDADKRDKSFRFKVKYIESTGPRQALEWT